MKFRNILHILLFLSLPVISAAQYYDTGQDPWHLKWVQIKTDNFTLIYPEQYGEEGIKYARSLEKSYKDLSLLFPAIKVSLPVIIHNYTTQANGYVSWAPKRIEIYPTPDQNTIPLDPIRQLTLHELTHVLQMGSLNRGFTRTLSIAFGEQFTGAVSSFLPLWFLEGDAVFAESVLTHSGRGRSPSFQKEIKALAIERGSVFKYDKMLNGSYRNYVPDHYQFGYQMVAWSFTKNDHQLWNKVLSYTANYPFTANPVNISLHKEAGTTKKKLFDETFSTLKTLWESDLVNSGATVYPSFNKEKNGRFVNYSSPVLLGKDSIIAIKTSLSDPLSFVLIRPSEKSENKILVPGYMYSKYISAGSRKLVWVESHYDPRWNNRNYSVIKLYNLDTKKTKQLTHRSRYLSVAISDDGKTIAATENTPENKNNLVFINPENGNITESLPVPGNAYLQRPSWSKDGLKLTFIALTSSGEGIVSYNLNNKQWETLIEPGNDDIQAAVQRNDSLFYISSLSGTENAYIKTANNQITLLTNSQFGVNDLFLSGNKIIFSDYSSSGNNICIINITNTPAYNNIRKPSSYLIDHFDTLTNKINNTENEKEYFPEPYKKWQHLFRFHSWMPLYADLEEVTSDLTSIRPGFTLLSQNTLSTLITSAGYEYSADHRHKFHSGITWKGWYPVFETQFDYGDEPDIEMFDITSHNPSNINPGMKLTNSVYVPLSFSSGKFSQYLYPYFSSYYTNKYIYIDEKSRFDNSQLRFTGRLYFSNYYRSSVRDIYPRWAQVIDISYTASPFDKIIYGNDRVIKGSFYFPGLFKNNGLRIRYENEKQVFGKYLISNKADFPRGYSDIVSSKLQSFSIDYVAPLAYPDINISWLLYITRVRAGLFFDNASGTNNYYLSEINGNTISGSYTEGTERFCSYGFELLSDFNILRIPYPISSGIRSSWIKNSQKPIIELLFSIDIYGVTIGRSRQ